MSILLTDHNWRDVNMYKYAKFDQNIPYGSRVMNIHIKRNQPAKMKPSEASSPFCIPVAEQH